MRFCSSLMPPPLPINKPVIRLRILLPRDGTTCGSRTAVASAAANPLTGGSTVGRTGSAAQNAKNPPTAIVGGESTLIASPPPPKLIAEASGTAADAPTAATAAEDWHGCSSLCPQRPNGSV